MIVDLPLLFSCYSRADKIAITSFLSDIEYTINTKELCWVESIGRYLCIAYKLDQVPTKAQIDTLITNNRRYNPYRADIHYDL